MESNSFANLDKSYNFLAGIGTYVGFDEGTIADMSIGVGVGGYIFAECYVHSFKSFASQYKSTFRETAKKVLSEFLIPIVIKLYHFSTGESITRK